MKQGFHKKRGRINYPLGDLVLSQLMIGFLLNNNLAPIGSSMISTCSPADVFEQRERNVPLASADVRGGGILRDEPKERLRRRLYGRLRVIPMSLEASM